jgi:hypothetical protein
MHTLQTAGTLIAGLAATVSNTAQVKIGTEQIQLTGNS